MARAPNIHINVNCHVSPFFTAKLRAAAALAAAVADGREVDRVIESCALEALEALDQLARKARHELFLDYIDELIVSAMIDARMTVERGVLT